MGGGRPHGHLADQCFDLNRACPLSLSPPPRIMVFLGLAMVGKWDPALPQSLAWSWCSGNRCSLIHKHIPMQPRCSLNLGLCICAVGQVGFGITDRKIPGVSELQVLHLPPPEASGAKTASPAPQEQVWQVVWHVWEGALDVTPESRALLAVPQVFPERRCGKIPGMSQSVGHGS